MGSFFFFFCNIQKYYPVKLQKKEVCDKIQGIMNDTVNITHLRDVIIPALERELETMRELLNQAIRKRRDQIGATSEQYSADCHASGRNDTIER